MQRSPFLVAAAATVARPAMDAVTVLRWTFLSAIPFAALLSLVFYAAFAPRSPEQEGTIKLGEGASGYANGHARTGRNGYARVSGGDVDENNEEEDKKVDLFDLEDDEIMLDGHPIQEEAFWKKVGGGFERSCAPPRAAQRTHI